MSTQGLDAEFSEFQRKVVQFYNPNTLLKLQIQLTLVEGVYRIFYEWQKFRLVFRGQQQMLYQYEILAERLRNLRESEKSLYFEVKCL